MSDDLTAIRPSLPGHVAGSDDFAGVTMSVAAPMSRFVLRGTTLNAAIEGLGFALPRQVNRAETQGGRAALCLSPDEFLILAPADEGTSLHNALETALASVPHALVDVSQRQMALIVAGRGGADILNAFVPLELTEQAFPIGMATRTIFEKAEIVLWRKSADTFHVEVWRSFTPYVWELLHTVRRENAAANAL